jgi:UDP-glucose 4-epimerase
MKLLVTGSAGFIGKNFLLKAGSGLDITAIHDGSEDIDTFLKDHGISNVSPLKCDLSKASDVSKTVEKASDHFDCVLYLAGNRDPKKSITDPLSDMESTVKELIMFLENFSCGKFVYLSTGAVYDGLKGRVSPDSGLFPTLPYAISRATAESYVRFFSERRKSVGKYVILRFYDAYGPYEPAGRLFSKLATTFAIEGRKEFTVFGNGENLVDAMYVDDAVEGFRKVLDKKIEKSMTVDFGCGNPMTLNQIVQKAALAFGIKDLKLNHTETSGAEHILFRSSSDEMEKMFSFKPSVPMEEGIRRLAAHIKEHAEGS